MDITALLAKLSPEDITALGADADRVLDGINAIPLPGPQTDAYFSEADVLLFGGSPGGGKSVLGILLALNEHYRALIVRKAFTDLKGIIDNSKKIVGSSNGFIGGSRPEYRKSDGGVIHYAGLAADGSIGGNQGVDHDLIYFDEAAQLTRNQVRMMMGWKRSDRPGQRCRVVFGSNPPLDSTGDWLIEEFAPWLDDTYHNPAKPGELRWFLPDENGKDRECEKDDYVIIEGIRAGAESRTFIPSKFTDNPYYSAEEYAKTLAQLPEEKRHILISGNFMLARNDDEQQVIPTDWIRQAQARWTERPPEGVPMCAIGVDVAQGGADNTVLAIRYDGWFAPMIVVAGVKTPHGPDVAGLVLTNRRDNALVIIDMGGGYGGSAYDHLKSNNIDVYPYKGAESSAKRTSDKQLKFTNNRTAAYWQFREALDPSQEGGSNIALPPDNELVADLTAVRYEIVPNGIKAEPKDKLKERLGRSPDKGDALVMAYFSGKKISTLIGGWNKSASKRRPTINLGHSNRKK